MTWLDDAKSDIRRDEVRRYRVYDDKTGNEIKCDGNPTIGDGINLNGVDDAFCDAMRDFKLTSVMHDLDTRFPWWVTRPEIVKRGLVNMAYNMGISRLSSFARMLAALQAGDYDTAANEAMQSDWQRQVGLRAVRIANLFRTAKNAAVA